MQSGFQSDERPFDSSDAASARTNPEPDQNRLEHRRPARPRRSVCRRRLGCHRGRESQGQPCVLGRSRPERDRAPCSTWGTRKETCPPPPGTERPPRGCRVGPPRAGTPERRQRGLATGGDGLPARPSLEAGRCARGWQDLGTRLEEPRFSIHLENRLGAPSSPRASAAARSLWAPGNLRPSAGSSDPPGPFSTLHPPLATCPGGLG